MTWYVYMLKCADNALYTGMTSDLRARVRTHNEGNGSKSVVMHGLPAVLVYYEVKDSKSAALRREAAIKKLTRQEKLVLVKSFLEARPLD